MLAEAWELYTRHARRLIATAAIGFGFLALVDILVDSAAGARSLLAVASVLVTIVGVFWLQGALALVADDLRAGRPSAPIAELFRRVQPRLTTLVPAGLLAAAGIAAGLLLFVLPGLVLLTFWSLVPATIVLEGRGVVASFRRSVELVRGNALRMFLVILLTVVLATVVGAVITALLAPLPAVVDVYLARVVANSVTVPFVALAWTLAYFSLRWPA